MKEYENENKKFSLNFFGEDINTESKGKIMNLSVCQDTSSIILLTDKPSTMMFSFQDILRFPRFLKKSKKHDKLDKKINEFIEQENTKNKKNNLLSQIIFEMNPSQEEDVSMAISLGKKVYTLQILKGNSTEVNHGENTKCLFIQWEGEFLICAFENRVIKIIKNFYVMKSLTEEDLFYSMKIVHWQNWNLLVLGYNRKVKILHFYYIYVDYGFKPLIISKLEGNIDIIEHKNQYILFCSKENKIIYCFRFMNNSYEPKNLFEINLYNFIDLGMEQEIISVKIISYEGIIVSFKNKIYLFYIKDDKFELNSTINVQDNIYFSSLIFNRNQYYLIYALQQKLKIIGIEIIQNNINPLYSSNTDSEVSKKIIDTCINTLLNRKNEFVIKKIDEYILHIEIDFVVLKLEFNKENFFFNFSILKCVDDFLKMKLEEEIKKIKSNIEEKIKIFNNNNDYNEYNDYVIEKILLINKIIKTTDFLDTTSEGESEIEKLKTEQFLKNYKIFKSWQVLTKLPVKNLFNEDDDYEFDLDKKIMSENLKNLIPKWNFKFDDLHIDKAFTFANSNYYNSSNTNNKNENGDNNTTHQLDIKSNKKENISREKYSMLSDILSQIKYYIQEIISQYSDNLIELYRETILNILSTLEEMSNLEFLFICIIPLSEIIWKEINKRSNLIITKSPLKTLKKNFSNASWSSELYNGNDDLSDSEGKDDLSLEFYTEECNINMPPISSYHKENYIKDNGKTSSSLDNNNYKEYKKRFTYTKKNRKSSDDFYKSKKMFSNNKFYKNNLSFFSNKNEKNFFELFTSQFCNKIIEFVNLFTEKLKLLNENSTDKSVFDFFKIANKYYEDSDINNEIIEIIKCYKNI